jgi:hypothetical protein
MTGSCLQGIVTGIVVSNHNGFESSSQACAGSSLSLPGILRAAPRDQGSQHIPDNIVGCQPGKTFSVGDRQNSQNQAKNRPKPTETGGPPGSSAVFSSAVNKAPFGASVKPFFAQIFALTKRLLALLVIRR